MKVAKRRRGPLPSGGTRGMPKVLWVIACRECGRVTDAKPGPKPEHHRRTSDNACPEHPSGSLDCARFVRWNVVSELVTKFGDD